MSDCHVIRSSRSRGWRVGAALLCVALSSSCAFAQGAQGGQYVVWGNMVQLPDSLLPYTQVSAGRDHAVGIRTDGSVGAWGSNLYGQSLAPAGAVALSHVAAGGYHTVALRLDGQVVCWGAGMQPPGSPVPYFDPQQGQSIVPADLPPCSLVAAGHLHSLAITADGQVRAWGYLSSTVNAPPLGLNSVRAVDGGIKHNTAVLIDGSIRCWGADDAGQTSVPAGTPPCVAVACGNGLEYQLPGGTSEAGHSVVLTSAGEVHAWGSNDRGQCSVPWSAAPATAVAAGSHHSVALKVDGSVVAWGSNDFNQCTPPTDLGSCKSITAGGGWVGAIEFDGDVRGWGNNESNQCEPPPRAGLVRSVDITFRHIVVARMDGTVEVFGENPFQVADVPLAVQGASISTVGAGIFHCLALSTTGALYAWGNNEYGQCSVPTEAGPFTSISAGFFHSMAVRTAQRGVVCWGSNSHGQCLAPPQLTTAPVDISVVSGGYEHSVALYGSGISMGSVACWGGNGFGQLETPPGVGPVIDLDAGMYHTVALKADRTVVCWGSNLDGQCDVPLSMNPVIEVAAGANHTVALLQYGAVVAWGSNTYSQTSAPGWVQHVGSIAAGAESTIAIVDYEHAVCNNNNGFLTPATLRVSGCRWEEVSVWEWAGGFGANVPGPGSTVDLGAYGSVGSECDASCSTLHAHGGSSILVAVDLTVPSADQPDYSIDVSGNANLAGRVWLIATGAATLPLDLNIPVLRAGNPVAGFDIVQTTVPAPAGYFLALVPSDGVQGQTLYSLRLLPL